MALRERRENNNCIQRSVVILNIDLCPTHLNGDCRSGHLPWANYYLYCLSFSEASRLLEEEAEFREDVVSDMTSAQICTLLIGLSQEHVLA